MSTEAPPPPRRSEIRGGTPEPAPALKTYQVVRTLKGFTINEIVIEQFAPQPIKENLTLGDLWSWMRKFDQRREETSRVIQWASESSDATITIRV